MILRRADCGHYIPEDVAPAGVHHGSEQPVYLCNECAERARGHRNVVQVETKVVHGTPALDLGAISEARHLGRLAAHEGKSEEESPYDKRTRDHRDWVRGHRDAQEAKADGGTGKAASHPG